MYRLSQQNTGKMPLYP